MPEETLKSLLLPLEWAYGSGVKLHHWLYSTGILKARTLERPVVSVGNLTTGGTGKTPTVIALGRMLIASGHSISILLRGYKGTYKGPALLVSDGKKILTSPEIAGDEALVISRNLPQAIVAVGRDRSKVGRKIEEAFNVSLHMLDDGFQHFRLSRNFNLLLIDTTDPFGGGHLLPRGRLREPLLGIARADAIALTRVREDRDYSSMVDCLKSVNAPVPYFKLKQTLVFGDETGSFPSCSPISLYGARVLAFAGIANPKQFFESLLAQGIEVIEGVPFRDHHRYTHRDLDIIRRKCQKMNVQIIVTTEKDRENLGLLSLAPLQLVVARVVFEFDQPMKLLELIREKTGLRAE